jgi:tetratricopeptide (TPR) repeat protein
MSEPKKLPGIVSRSVMRALLAVSLLALAGAASAKPEDITEPEMKLIPRYCADTMGFKYGDAYYNTSPRAGHWVALMGKGFWAMHHYCWARINMNRAQRAGVPAQTRRALWESARGDYGYVVNNTVPDFIMLPEIYTRIGEVELLLAHPDKANLAFIRARELKPDYWPAYSHWAEFLIAAGKRADALKVVAAGLEHAPESRVLLEQFRVLGGRKSDIPKPKEKPPETADAATGPVAPEAAMAAEAPAAGDAAHDDK